VPHLVARRLTTRQISRVCRNALKTLANSKLFVWPEPRTRVTSRVLSRTMHTLIQTLALRTGAGLISSVFTLKPVSLLLRTSSLLLQALLGT